MPFSIFRIRTVAGANVCRRSARRGHVLELLHPHAVRAAGAALLGPEDGRDVRGDGGQRRPVGRPRRSALVTKIGAKPVMVVGLRRVRGRDASWYTQIPADGSFVGDLLPGYLLVGFALPFTFIPVSIAALAGVERTRGRARLGPLQHDPAGRRRDRRRGGLVGLDQPLQPPDRDGDPVRRRPSRAASQWAFWVMFGCALAAIVATLTLIRRDELARRRRDAARRRVAAYRPDSLRGDGARVPDRPRPGRVDADRPARPDLARRRRGRSSPSSSS